ncbi:MAG: hypothetical protein DDT39_01090 [Firmicutes bacterium]|nr:hypothetical protein [candidate division NPL-UPA2 bacterium]
MRFSVDRLVKAISERRSTRNFTGHPISAEILEALAHTKDLQPLGLASCRTVLLYDPAGFDTVFTGIVGSYGKIRGATAILVLVVPASSGDEGKLEAGFIGHCARGSDVLGGGDVSPQDASDASESYP